MIVAGGHYMMERLKGEVGRHGDRVAVIPIGKLEEIKRDIEKLKATGFLNNNQKYLVSEYYDLNIPETGFEVRSILIVASPSPAMVNVGFCYNGKKIKLPIPATYVDYATAPGVIGKYLNEFLNPQKYHVAFSPKLPRKLLAVRSGLGRYGRNNVCYVEGMGSFANISTFFSDLPCPEETWQEIGRMELCKRCRICLNQCPTGAIRGEHFLIDNEKCVTYFNESAKPDVFPEWMDPKSHNSIVGCLKCQAVCPANKTYLSTAIDSVEFTELETVSLLKGIQEQEISGTFREKLESLYMFDYLDALPRNLNVLLTNSI